ncbi:DUF2199 domain-containing protein [Longispora sp. K20-0274]|uniref:DUF2199 domain-containing protein n=1 Tax=Longispora sp. K20-0274 TaxID=3088255 RepID=UPI00399C495A
MVDEPGFTCSCCGQWHGEPPLSFGAPAPDFWREDLAGDPGFELTRDRCVVGGEAFFLRGLIEIPVLDTGNVFSWGVWVSLSQSNYARAGQVWEQPGREGEPPYFGWLSTELTAYPVSTINLKTNLHTRPLGLAPLIELEPTDHPLAVEQRTGITTDRLRQISEMLLHPPAART